MHARGEAASSNVRGAAAPFKASRRLHAAVPVSPSTEHEPGFVGTWLSSCTDSTSYRAAMPPMAAITAGRPVFALPKFWIFQLPSRSGAWVAAAQLATSPAGPAAASEEARPPEAADDGSPLVSPRVGAPQPLDQLPPSGCEQRPDTPR